MSDDPADSANQNANQGITLPNGKNATYNTGLSPIFLNRSGRRNTTDMAELTITYRGQNDFIWSSTSYVAISAYRMGFNGSVLSPSNYSNHTYADALRCLVSTNDR